VVMNRVITLGRSTRTTMSMSLIAIAGIAMYGWIVSPHVAYLHAVQKYEPVVKEVAKEKDDLCTALGLKQQRLQTMQSELSKLRDRLFTPDEAQGFLDSLETSCQKAGCSVTSIEFPGDGSRAETAKATELPVVQVRRANLVVIGQYGQIVALLERLQDRPQQVGTDSCRIELLDVASARLKCDLTMTIWVACIGGDPNDR
jgi:Tfp pilus assembly protein PilO